MATAAQNDIADALYQVVLGVPGIKNVYDRPRYPEQMTEQQMEKLFQAPDGSIQTWQIQRVRQRATDLSQMDTIREMTYIYALDGYLSVNDVKDSAATFDGLIDAIQAALVADQHLGLDAGVSQHGLEIPRDIAEETYAGVLCHAVHATISVAVGEC
jgi:hypothetical protein